MTTALTSENIQTLHGERLAGLSGWEISFRSDNQGMHHQMYVNGQLADFTDTLSQRAFHVDLEDFPQEIAIVAVDSHRRMSDMSAELPSQLGQPTWIRRIVAVQQPQLPVGSLLAYMDDHTTGQMDSSPLVERIISPAWSPNWGFGNDCFAYGGFGYDATAAPGCGQGTFGAGGFGFDARTTQLAASLSEEGLHQCLIRLTSPENISVDARPEEVSSLPPPEPPAKLQAVSYNAETQQLNLQIQ